MSGILGDSRHAVEEYIQWSSLLVLEWSARSMMVGMDEEGRKGEDTQ